MIKNIIYQVVLMLIISQFQQGLCKNTRLEAIIKLFQLFIILSIFFSSTFSYAAVDRELIQSARCVGYFRHFETRLKIPRDTLYSISIQETGKTHIDKKVKIAWPWTANVEGKGYYFDTKQQAVQFVREQMLAGKESIDVGCMQVNLKHHPDAFRSLDHAFDPRSNIAYGAKFLISKYEQLGSWSKAIGHYHSATPHLGEKYKDSVVKIAQNIDHYKSAFKRKPNSQTERLVLNTQPKNLPTKYAALPPLKSKPHFINKERKYRSNMMVYVPKSNKSFL